jgi:hypothetical protein
VHVLVADVFGQPAAIATRETNRRDEVDAEGNQRRGGLDRFDQVRCAPSYQRSFAASGNAKAQAL